MPFLNTTLLSDRDQLLTFTPDDSALPVVAVILVLSVAAVTLVAAQLLGAPWSDQSFSRRVPLYKQRALSQGLQLLHSHTQGLFPVVTSVTNGLQPLTQSDAVSQRSASGLAANDKGNDELAPIAVIDPKIDEPLNPNSDDIYVHELSTLPSATGPLSLDGLDVSQLSSMLEEQKQLYLNYFQSQSEYFAAFYDRIAAEFDHMRQLLSVKLSVTLQTQQEGLSESIDRLVSGELLSRQNTMDLHHRHVTIINTQLFELITLIRNINESYTIQPIKQSLKKIHHDIQQLEKLWRQERNRRKNLPSHVQIIGRPIIEILSNTDKREEPVIDDFLSAFLHFATSSQETLTKMLVEDLNHASIVEQIDESNTVKRDYENDRYHLIVMKFVRELQSHMTELQDKLKPLTLPLKQCEDDARVTWIYVQGPLVESRWREVNESQNRYGRLFRGINDELAKVLVAVLGLRGGLVMDESTGQLVPKEPFDPRDPFSPIFDHTNCKDKHGGGGGTLSITDGIQRVTNAASIAANVASMAANVSAAPTNALPMPAISLALNVNASGDTLAGMSPLASPKAATAVTGEQSSAESTETALDDSSAMLAALLASHEQRILDEDRLAAMLEALKSKLFQAKQSISDEDARYADQLRSLMAEFEIQQEQELVDTETIDEMVEELKTVEPFDDSELTPLQREVRQLLSEGISDIDAIKDRLHQKQEQQRQRQQAEAEAGHQQRQKQHQQQVSDVEASIDELQQLPAAIKDIRAQQVKVRSPPFSSDESLHTVSVSYTDSADVEREAEITIDDSAVLDRLNKMHAKQRAVELKVHNAELARIQNSDLSDEEKHQVVVEAEHEHDWSVTENEKARSADRASRILSMSSALQQRRQSNTQPRASLNVDPLMERQWIDQALEKLPQSLSNDYLLELVRSAMAERHQQQLTELMVKLAHEKQAAIDRTILQQQQQQAQQPLDEATVVEQVCRQLSAERERLIAALESQHRKEIMNELHRHEPLTDPDTLTAPALSYTAVADRSAEVAATLAHAANLDPEILVKQKRLVNDFSMPNETKARKISDLLVELAGFDDRMAAEKLRQEADLAKKLAAKKQKRQDTPSAPAVPASNGAATAPVPVESLADNLPEGEDAATLMARLMRIEAAVRAMNDEARAWRQSSYVDAKDLDELEYQHRETLRIANIRSLPLRCQLLNQFALTLVQLFHRLSLIHTPQSSLQGEAVMTPVVLKIASSLPVVDHQYCTAYRNSFYWDSASNTLYVRQERLADPGELTMVLVYALAHISAIAVREQSGQPVPLTTVFDDRDAIFQHHLHALMRVIAGDLFFASVRSNSDSGSDSGLGSVVKTRAVTALIEMEPHAATNPLLSASTYAHWPEFNASRLHARMSEYRTFAYESSLQSYLQDLESSMRARQSDRDLDWNNSGKQWNRLADRPNESMTGDELDDLTDRLNQQLVSLVRSLYDQSHKLHQFEEVRQAAGVEEWTASHGQWSECQQLLAALHDEKERLMSRLLLVQQARNELGQPSSTLSA